MRRPIVSLLAGLWLVGCASGAPDGGWTSAPEADHADSELAGRIWDVAAARTLAEGDLITRLASVNFVLLGEKHDNADHHRLQAQVLTELAGRGRRPAVVFEMFPVEVSEDLAWVQGRDRVDQEDIRRAVRWDSLGWPDWSLYEPVVTAALDARMPIVAADLPRDQVRRLRAEGLAALSPDEARMLGLTAPFPADQEAALEDEIREAHCGYLPEPLAVRLAGTQRARDAHLAMILDRAAYNADGGVLIAGAGHVRNDRAVPFYLRRRQPEATLAVLAWLEADEGSADIASQLRERFGDRVPFDYVWFTPPVNREDPCEKYREQLERMGLSEGEEAYRSDGQ